MTIKKWRRFSLTLTLFLGLALLLRIAVDGLPVAAQEPAPLSTDEMMLVQVTHLTDTTSTTFYDALLSGNGRKVVYGAPWGYSYERTLYLANSDGTGTPYAFYSSVGDPDIKGLRLLDVSYDGKRILYFKDRRSGECDSYAIEHFDPCGYFLYDVETQTSTRATPCYTDSRISTQRCLSTATNNIALSGNGNDIFLVSGSSWQCTPESYDYGWRWNCRIPGDQKRLWRVPITDLGNPDAAELWGSLNDALPESSRLYSYEPLYADYAGGIAAILLTITGESGGTLPESGIYFSRGSRLQRVPTVDSVNHNYLFQLSADGNWVAYSPPYIKEYHIQHVSGSPHYTHPVPDSLQYNYLRGVTQDGQQTLFEDRMVGEYPLWIADREGNFSPLTGIAPGPLCDSAHLSYDGQKVACPMDKDNTGDAQYYVLHGQANPDLSVDAFTLDPAAVTHSAGKYILPVDITVRNTGQSAASDIQVRLSDNGGWSETRTIDTLNSDASTVLHLNLDITAQLDQGNGQATVELTATADPDDAIFEAAEVNNTASASTDVDARPRILQVQPQFRLASAYFLNNQSVNNPIKALVDWNGDLAGNGDPPYGDVYFDLNGVQVSEAGQSWGAEHTYDMGSSDFQSSFSCANNTLQVWAVGDFESLKSTLQPTVFPFPGWVDWLENLHLGEFSTEEQAPLVEYTYAFKYPEDPFEATWTPPGWVPYLGGHELGILETQSEANATGKSDGAGSVGVSGQTGLGLGALNVDGNLSGRGDARFTCGESLDLTGAELNFGIHATVEQEAGLADVVPAVRAAEDWPVVGRVIRWVNESAQVKASLTPGIDIATQFEARDGELQFVNGEGTGSIDARVELSTEPCQDLSASVYGGGTPYVTVQVPKNPGYFKEVGIDLYYGATFQAWEFETEYERKVNCHYPGECSDVESSGMMAMADGADWHLIPRNYAVSGPMLRATGVLLQATSTTTETVLVSPAYARPEPALAVRADGLRLLAYVHDDDAKPHGRGTEIRTRAWDGSWGSPVSLTDDQQPDFAPAVAFDGDGDGLVVWERSTLATGITPALNITFAQSLEIVARTWVSSTATWGDVVTLTNDSLMDHAPRLSAGNDGTVMALWQTNDGTDILGTAAHPLTFTYAIWDGSTWGSPAAALTGLHDVLGAAFAAYSSTQAALVYAVDADGLLTTTHDSDLYYATFDGASWSSPARLTNDTITDITPALAYDGSGNLHLLWLRDGDLVWLENSWNVGDARTVRAASTEAGFMGFTLNRDPAGNLAVVWQGTGDGSADLTYSIYDDANDSWGADNTLMSDSNVEAAHSPAFGSDGTLYAAYQQVATEFVTKTFTSPSTFTVTNIPTPGVSSLVFVEHTVGRDLTFVELTITPTNPAPGQAVTLTAVLRNAGDLAVVNPQVAFYDGASQIGSTQTLSTLAAGYTTTVQASWTVPALAAAHTLKAVADPNGQVMESDETNNEVTWQTVLPDLQVEVLYTAHSTATITATARLVNTGVLAAAAPFDVAFRAADPLTGTLLGTVAVGSDLGVGEQVTVTLALTDTASLAGLGDLLWAIADAGEMVAEADEGNNSDYARLAVLPDLTLTAADIAGSGPVVVTVRNAGVVTATAPVVAARQGGPTGPLVYSGTLSTLGPGDSDTVTLTSVTGQIELWAYADPDHLIAESDESNNLAVREIIVPFRIYLPLVLRSS